MVAWVYILMSSTCAVLVAHFLKYVEFNKLGTLRVLTVNYFFAAGIAFLTTDRILPATETATQLYPVAGIALFVGVIFILNFFIFSKSVDVNGLGISVAAMRLSLIIPVLLSTFWYQEYLTGREWAGISLVFVTLFLLLPNKRDLFKSPYQAAWLLPLLFLFTGIGDSSFKIFESDFSELLTKESFMGAVFLTAFITGSIAMAIRNDWNVSGKEVLLGFAVGVPNLYSTLFLIEALTMLSGGIVYTAANLFTVIGATILGIWWWKDRLTRAQWAGLFLTLISITLLI